MLRLVKQVLLTLFVMAFTMQSVTAKEAIRVALDDLPGVDMLPTLIAIEKAKERGVPIKVSYMLSEGMAMRAILNKKADIGMGTPYQKIQQTGAPVRMFYQLNMLRFHPMVDSRHYSDWSELNGVVMYSHGKGSGTEALVNMLAKKNGITYSKMVYLPGSGVRANAMINGRIHATVVDTERKNKLLGLPHSPFRVLPMETINASDEALYAHESFIRSHKLELGVLVEELLQVWQTMNADPGYILEQRNALGLLPDLSEAEVSQFFAELVAEGAFANDGGLQSAFAADLDFYGFAGTISDPGKQKAEQYWDFSLLQAVLPEAQ